MFDVAEIVYAGVVMLAASIVVSTVAFGMGMVATPLLLLALDPQTIVVMVNVFGVFVFATIVFQDRRTIPYREVLPFSAAGLVGVPIGIAVLTTADESFLRIGITVLILALATVVALDLQGGRRLPTLLGIGIAFVVGATTASFGIGGPLTAIFFLSRYSDRYLMRASLSLFHLTIMGTGVIGYAFTGLITADLLVLIAAMALPVLVGFRIAGYLTTRMNDELFRKGVIAIIVVTSVLVLGRELTAL